MARETFVLWKPLKPGAEVLWINAVQGQAVRVYDAASGKLVLETPVSPILDDGGNVAFSPSGRRIAVLNNGAIEVFDLPAAAPVPNR
jgi:WD40 repeat protein